MNADDIEREIASIEQGLVDLLNRLYQVRKRALGGDTPVAASPGLDIKERSYRPAEDEDWKHVVDAAHELDVSRDTAWRWAEEYFAQWPHGAPQLVDFNKLRHLGRPRRAKNAKFAK